MINNSIIINNYNKKMGREIEKSNKYDFFHFCFFHLIEKFILDSSSTR